MSRSLVRDLQRVAAVKLQNTRGVPKSMKDKLELIELAFGYRNVVEDFEKWCEEQKAKSPQYPVFEYLKMVDARLGSANKVDSKDPRIKNLQALTYELTNVLPHTNAIRGLLALHEEQEIKEALEEYVASLDEKDFKKAMRAFYDDEGATAIIYSRKKREEKP